MTTITHIVLAVPDLMLRLSGMRSLLARYGFRLCLDNNKIKRALGL